MKENKIVTLGDVEDAIIKLHYQQVTLDSDVAPLFAIKAMHSSNV